MPEQSWRGTTPIWNCETAAQYAPTQPVAQGSRLAHASSDVHEESPYPSLRRSSDIYNLFMTQETSSVEQVLKISFQSLTPARWSPLRRKSPILTDHRRVPPNFLGRSAALSEIFQACTMRF